MAELKHYDIKDIEAMDDERAKDAKPGQVINCTRVYIKSEADKVIADKDKEIRSLKRELWLARAYRGRDNSILLPSKFMRNVWDNVERKCLKKAGQYK